jgi:hypothetical protein
MFGIYATKGDLILNKPKNAQLFRYLFGSTFDESRFLENSPSTERDEMGEENNSSPGAKAILRRAGLIKGAVPAPEMHAASPNISSSDVSSSSESESTPRLAVAEDSNVQVSNPDSGVYRNAASAATEEPRPRRRSRRERERAERESTRSSTGSRPHVELSVPDDELRSSDGSPTRSSDESPVPQPESESTARSESPVPRAE